MFDLQLDGIYLSNPRVILRAVPSHLPYLSLMAYTVNRTMPEKYQAYYNMIIIINFACRLSTDAVLHFIQWEMYELVVIIITHGKFRMTTIQSKAKVRQHRAYEDTSRCTTAMAVAVGAFLCTCYRLLRVTTCHNVSSWSTSAASPLVAWALFSFGSLTVLG